MPADERRNKDSFIGGWKPLEHTNMRRTYMATVLLISIALGVLFQTMIVPVIGIFFVAAYLVLGIIDKDPNKDDLYLRGDAKENEKIDLYNLFVSSLIDIGVINAKTQTNQVFIEVVDTYPKTFILKLTQPHTFNEKMFDNLCPVFDAERCEAERIDNQSYRITFYENGLFAELDTVYKWGDFLED